MSLDLSYSEDQEEVFFNWPEGVKYKIIKKGRRSGLTKGAANAFIDYLYRGVSPLLWGDTINGNIQKYFDRYFLPELKKNKITHKFDKINKQLTINGCFCDFRSSDNPENWEGFGYKLIFLNEAGIILKNRYLYTNSVLPMMMDYPDSKLIAGGVPKGKFLKDGTEHPFYTLNKRAEAGLPQYQSKTMTPYNSPFINDKDVKELEEEIAQLNTTQVDQEIYGMFIDSAGTNPFMTCYDPKKHESELAIYQPSKQLKILLDFNMNPFCFVFAHQWRDENGEHFHIFNEIAINGGSIPASADQIKLMYQKNLPSCLITGDAMGKRGDISQRDNATLYLQLSRLLRISPTAQIKVPGNPTHENSRGDCNYILYHFPDFKINPLTCPNTCRDMKTVQSDNFGDIVKANRNDATQRADFLDCVRYGINTWLTDWIKRHKA